MCSKKGSQTFLFSPKATGGIQLSSDQQNFEEVNTLSVENEDVHSMYEQFVQSLKKVPLPFILSQLRKIEFSYAGILCCTAICYLKKTLECFAFKRSGSKD